MKTVEYLDAVKKQLGITSDYGLQGPLRVTKSAISRYRNHSGTFDHLVAARVAVILGIPELRVIADIEIERAERSEQTDQGALWTRLAKKVAVVVIVAIGGAIAAPSPVEAVAAVRPSPCVLCKIARRRLLAWLFGPPGLAA